MDSTKTLKTFPRNPLSSHVEPECSEGMVALWMIEGVRQGGKFPSLNALCLRPAVERMNRMKESEENHKEAAQAYRAWWDKAKTLTLEQAMKINPLQGTNLAWH